MKKYRILFIIPIMFILAITYSYRSFENEFEQVLRLKSVSALNEYIQAHPTSSLTSDANKEILRLNNLPVPDGMILVEGGSFMMGSETGDKDEKPVHKVTLKSFYMDKYEITNEQFCKFLNEKGNQSEGDGKWLDIGDEDCKINEVNKKFVPERGFENHPVLELSWYGAKAYAAWVGKRLPTEAEWEYAARGGKLSKNFIYAGSNTIDEVAWFTNNSDNSTHPIGSKKPNELGIFDMSGNVWEWCSDWYQEDAYKYSVENNPIGPESGKYRVLRGGSWVSIDKETKTTSRDYGFREDAFFLNGFRLVKEL
jgi:formylglycine-generating enzyme required for sulfatase activity